jgi:hypothetical protein
VLRDVVNAEDATDKQDVVGDSGGLSSNTGRSCLWCASQKSFQSREAADQSGATKYEPPSKFFMVCSASDLNRKVSRLFNREQ